MQKNGATATTLVDLVYGYDTSNNRTRVDNKVATTGWDYAYGYDALDRLTTADRGDLTGGAIANVRESEAWTLDSTGNWTSYRHLVTAGENLVQSRQHNTVNEITAIDNAEPPQWVVPTYDTNGNTLVLPRPADPSQAYDLTWDAWNRLVRVDAGGSPLVAYAYDGLGRRITETPAGAAPRHYFYSSSWQTLEERVGSSQLADRQYLWGLRYIDDYAFQDVFTSGTGVRHWGLQDGNWNVVGLTDDVGVVQQRYAYDAYGTPIYLTPTFLPQTPPAVTNPYTFTGRQFDDTQLYYYRTRYYDCKLGRFNSADPIGYDRQASLYSYGTGQPTIVVDPSGLRTLTMNLPWAHLEMSPSTDDTMGECRLQVTVRYKLVVVGGFLEGKERDRLIRELTTQVNRVWRNRCRYTPVNQRNRHCRTVVASFNAEISENPSTEPHYRLEVYDSKVVTGALTPGAANHPIPMLSTPGLPAKIAYRAYGGWRTRNQSVVGRSQINQPPFAHEFGHGLGFAHPGPVGSPSEYLADARSIMGLGTIVRPKMCQAYAPFISALFSESRGCSGLWVSRGFNASKVRESYLQNPFVRESILTAVLSALR